MAPRQHASHTQDQASAETPAAAPPTAPPSGPPTTPPTINIHTLLFPEPPSTGRRESTRFDFLSMIPSPAIPMPAAVQVCDHDLLDQVPH